MNTWRLAVGYWQQPLRKKKGDSKRPLLTFHHVVFVKSELLFYSFSQLQVAPDASAIFYTCLIHSESNINVLIIINVKF